MFFSIGARLALSLGLIAAAHGVRAAEPVAITILIDPIYTGTPVTGPASRIFEAAGLSATIASVPASRILGMIKANTEADCSPGWFKTPERAAYARFTRPFHVEMPYVGLVRAGYSIEDETTAEQALTRPSLRLGVKQGYSYTPFFDALIARMPAAHVVTVTGDLTSIVKMVHGKHIDLMIAHKGEVEKFVAEAGLALSNFRLVKFADTPKEMGVAIMCSAQVSSEVVDRLNAAIAATAPQ